MCGGVVGLRSTLQLDGVEFRARVGDTGAFTGSYWLLCFACLSLNEAT